MGFGQGLSGLNAAAQSLDVIGNNIANSGTVGFKASTATFADVYASSRVGLGVKVASVNQRFTIGPVSDTGNQFDIAIDGEKGLFRVQDASGSILYTRNGQFFENEDNYIVNAQGQRLTGYPVGSVNPAPVMVPSGNIAPMATSSVQNRFNLDANQPKPASPFPAAGPVAPDQPAPDTYNFQLPMDVYDSLGNPHQLTQYFIKGDPTGTGHSTWTVRYKFGDEILPDNYSMEFTGSGVFPDMLGPTVTLNITGVGAALSPADDLEIVLDYTGTSQFSDEFSHDFNQNGYTSGEYASMSIAKDGTIVARYTNGKTQEMGTLVLADFRNLQGLQPVGGNAWIETSESGQPILGVPGTNGMAKLMGQAVEESNVDMSQELVNMIIAQRTYQANAQTIKTQDQILQTLITMR